MDLQCALTVPGLKDCPSKKPCYTAAVATYDAFSHNKIPRSAHLLSAVSGFKFSIVSGSTLIPIVLDGIVGPDGAIWFTEAFTNKIGRLR
jgi:streptogramin lyase